MQSSACTQQWPNAPAPAAALEAYRQTRAQTERLCAGLSAEDCQLQSAPCCSPVKWHLAHTTWFFEYFILRDRRISTGSEEQWHYLYNSYYLTAGAMTPRAERGLISRPNLAEVLDWRGRADEAMIGLLEHCDDERVLQLTRLGIEHERQHQELILMDIKHHFFANPGYPAYDAGLSRPPLSTVGSATSAVSSVGFDGGIVPIGRPPAAPGDDFTDSACFGYDNESPMHEVVLSPFAIDDRLVSCGDYLAFIDDGGYQRVEFWFADAWEWLKNLSCPAPLYWVRSDDRWMEFTLSGLHPLRADLPVSHLSYYEASAYARWAGKRLPTEFELEWAMMHEYNRTRAAPEQSANPAAQPAPTHADPHASAHAATLAPADPHASAHADPHASAHAATLAPADLSASVTATQPALGNFLDSGYLAPVADRRFCGNLWQWTSSAYAPYPGFKPLEGSIGEYNGKFMVNQQVLRGGSCVTPAAHFHPSRRNFFYSGERWVYSGLRLCDF